jgi:hypothetical protein
MKISSIIIAVVLFVWCLSSYQSAAQTKGQTKTPLAVWEAEPLAMRLANDKFKETTNYRNGVFNTNLPSYYMGGTVVTTNYTDGHWIFKFSTRTPHDSCDATVELASDGSTNLVTIKKVGGLP